LLIGSHTDNACDRDARGRSARGNRHGRVKLREQQLARLREMAAAGGKTHEELAVIFGLTQFWVSQILRGDARISS
jgi:hypothetical protein